MKAIMVMFDTLNRHMLPPYGCDWTHAPNFARLAERTVTFDNCYVGSMPCMPARRELHTGRYNFLHRSWGPLEPFDDSMPELLSENGIYTHLSTDHLHYFEDGGASYHTRYDSWDYHRGQEGDAWIGQVEDPAEPESLNRIRMRPEGLRRNDHKLRQDWINREFMDSEEKQPQAKTFGAGLEFCAATRGRTAGSCKLRPSTRTSLSSRNRSTRTYTRTSTAGSILTGLPTDGLRNRRRWCGTCATSTPRC